LDTSELYCIGHYNLFAELLLFSTLSDIKIYLNDSKYCGFSEV